MRVYFLWFVAIVVVAAGIAAWAFLGKTGNEKGTYYRFKIGLTYKDKPVDLDIVVGCGVHDWAGNPGTGGSTAEVMGMTAYRFGWRTPDGHALVIHTVPNSYAGACLGEFGLPAEWLPLIVWYEREDDFAHGIAYATQDAYENPNAKFGFRGAKIGPAGRADYEDYLKRGPKNILPRNLANVMVEPSDPHLWNKSVDIDKLAKHPTSAWPYSGPPWCFGVRRIRLSEAQRAKVRAWWPPDKPNYWSLKTSQEQLEEYHKLLTEDQWGSKLAKYFAAPDDTRRKGQPEIYPTLAGEGLAQINKDSPVDDRYVHEILIDPALRGFKYCDEIAPPQLVEKITHHRATIRDNIICRIGDYTIPTNTPHSGGCQQEVFWLVFENDEYAIIAEDVVI